jgi:hypothetical protein
MFSFCFLVVLRVAVLRVLAIGMFSLQDIDGGLTFGNNTNLSDNPDTNSDRVIMLAREITCMSQYGRQSKANNKL